MHISSDSLFLSQTYYMATKTNTWDMHMKLASFLGCNSICIEVDSMVERVELRVALGIKGIIKDIFLLLGYEGQTAGTCI